ncbi:hypothetical protein P153DRAFT_382493 [Dothidotthia symphoricarpi CBS 119687]|uniref:Uncharacterized protein n=1 Tax=Dothidotthia symphoricarpi CBS 119687 TaxID=1392245 RepID=A0A6A6ALK3_9PLEO|nr:uncharacterized protein P153DRAFT_382493 [Dothidotthia symphoricarpi CBS 119687]KAF2132872.1 hypothetical protein P153DRAFT_382493 [Dothidotthia symphoricarpi CBS 119687]
MSPSERPARPLVVPSLLRDSALSWMSMCRFGWCVAADERLRRWPAEAEKEEWEASVTFATCGYERNCQMPPTRIFIRGAANAHSAQIPLVGVQGLMVEHCRRKVREMFRPGGFGLKLRTVQRGGRTFGGKEASRLPWNVEADQSRRRDRCCCSTQGEKAAGNEHTQKMRLLPI